MRGEKQNPGNAAYVWLDGCIIVSLSKWMMTDKERSGVTDEIVRAVTPGYSVTALTSGACDRMASTARLHPGYM